MDGGRKDEMPRNSKEGRIGVRNGWTAGAREEKRGREERSSDRVRDGRLDGAAASLALSFHDGWCVFFPSYLVCHVRPCTEELCLVTTSGQSRCFSEG